MGFGHRLAQFGERFPVPERHGQPSQKGRSGNKKSGFQNAEAAMRGRIERAFSVFGLRCHEWAWKR